MEADGEGGEDCDFVGEVEDSCSSKTLLPDESARWFHGYIGHREAENRLLAHGKSGAFLIQSKYNDSNLYLSYFHKGTVLHLPITVICGHYFLADRQFRSLTHLVTYFTKSPQSPLVEPFPPPHEIVLKNRRRIALLPYKALKGTDELSFFKGDFLIELQEVSADWIWATLEGRKESGLVPVALTALLDEVSDPTQLPYYHEGDISTLAHRLIRAGKDSFLLRKSSNGENFVIMVNIGMQIAKVLVERRAEGGYLVGGRIFLKVSDVVDRYERTEISDGCQLLYPHIRDKASDYAELKVSNLTRMNSHSSCPQPIASVSALMKTREWKKWKSCFLMLSDANGSQLYLFDSTTRTKPKIIVNLCFCTVLKLDESVFLRDDCVQLVVHGIESNSIYLAFTRRSAFFQWFSHLKWRSLGLRNPNALYVPYSNSKMRCYKPFNFIEIALSTYRSCTLKADVRYIASVVVNGYKLCSTKCRSASPNSSQIIFDAVFFLEWIPIPSEAGSCTIQLVIHSVSNNKKPRIFDSSPVYKLSDSDEDHLSLKGTGDESAFCFEAHRYRITVLPEAHYSSFHALLSAHDFALCQWTSEMLSTLERTVFCRSLIATFLKELTTLVRMVATVVDEHLNSTSAEVLFRSDSFCTTLISSALRMIAFGTVKERLIEILSRIANGFDEGESELDEFLEILKNLIPKLPPAFFAVLSTVADRTALAFPNKPHLRRRSVSAFFFLRFINPLVLFFESSSSTSNILRKFVRIIQNAINEATSLRYSSETSSNSVHILVEILDLLSSQPSQSQVLILRNEYYNYNHADYLAILSFFVSMVLSASSDDDDNNNALQDLPSTDRYECPVRETEVVLNLLQNHANHFIAGHGSISP
ncbi:hypothetical protein L596_008178 [Steinernema carpocapsae]|uniref:SH2 domain-containing protein n=1 Tax=Steinernema carpocapsae TaxID=34508 RepID=A0A4U5PC75_STECR|nr:hypothetical protein L596_008178 [Steinernema carpocapsae]